MRNFLLYALLALSTPAAAVTATTDTTTTVVAPVHKKKIAKTSAKKLAAKTAKSSKSSSALPTGTEKVGTDFHFNDQTVHGHYQSPNEGIVTVEDEKSLGDLIDYHTEYKSRLKESLSIQ